MAAKPILLTVADLRGFKVGTVVSIRGRACRVHGVLSRHLIVRPLGWHQQAWLFLKSHLWRFLCKVPRP
jgi:hypothetical protein